jgi:hypothetical protein
MAIASEEKVSLEQRDESWRILIMTVWNGNLPLSEITVKVMYKN